jgi:DNA-directed RNA polymerase specialized sigma24 family protein
MAPQLSFQSTHWSVIRRAQAGGPEARDALEQLIRRYDGFVLASLRRARRPRDLTLERLLKDLPRVEEGRGKFRGWLSCAMRSYLCNAWKRWWAKTNPSPHTDCFDVLELNTSHTAEHELLRSFALDTLRHADRLQRQRLSNPERFEALRQFLPGPDMNFEEITAVARPLRLSAVATRKAIHDLRAQFRECLNEAVADTLDLEECAAADSAAEALAVERELKQLCASLFPAGSSEVAFVR